MRTLHTIRELRAALAAPRREGLRVGLVATMGAFHDGHLSLMRRARSQCDRVVVSLFVNPTQFNEHSDLASYPRDPERDARMAAEQRVDLLFAPSVEEIYPPGFATTVTVGGLPDVLEGAHRGRRHFDGVATVVTKLLAIVAPDTAYFGQKDAQQTLLIRRLVRDLDLPVEIEVCPTVREPDGLAMSSRNALLSVEQRARASVLHRSLQVAQALLRAGETDVNTITAAAHEELEAALVQAEYFELVDPQTLAPALTVQEPVLAVVAARVGAVRLIDNQLLSPGPTSSRPPAAAGSTHRSD